MTFDEIPMRMLQLGVDRAWLATECDYTPDSLRQILAPNGKGKTQKALRRIWEALDREEERQRGKDASPEPIPFRVVLEPSKERFDRWMQAVYAKPGRNFDDWATTGLDALAEREIGTYPTIYTQPEEPFSKIAENETLYRARIELPFFGVVAAGTPCGALDELSGDTMPVIGDHPKNSFLVRVSGDSMTPDYDDGDILVCRPLKVGEYAKKNDDVIACDPTGAFLKRLTYTKEGVKGDAPRKATPRLTSINPAYPDVTPVTDCPVRAIVIGKATILK
jgi:SOS-response transcriptional repressor LexA